MVRILQKFLGVRDRGVDTPRSPSGAHLCGTVSRPCHRCGKPRRSCRLQLEPLEDRLTPSALDFVPIANVVFHDLAVTKIPLPPGVQIDFDPLLIGSATGGAGTGKITEQIHIGGVLQKQITIPAPTAGTPGQVWTLDAFYNLTANDSLDVVAPNAFGFGDGSVRGLFSVTGTMAGFLTPMALTTGTTSRGNPGPWTFTGTVTEQGTVNGLIPLPDPTTGNQTVTFQFQDQIGENLTLGSNGVQGGSIGGTPGGNTWQEQILLNSAGSLMETVAGGATTAATFWQQDQVTECLMQVNPFHPPNPCITINETFSAWGSVTETMLFPQTAFTPEVDTGTSQYQVQLSETILMPDGSMQTVTQNSMDMGTFFEIKEWS